MSNMFSPNLPVRQSSTKDFDSEIKILLSYFTNDLPKDEQNEIENVSFEDLIKAIAKIEERQRRKKSYRNLNRIRPFVTGMNEYGKVIGIFANAVPIVAFVWVG